MERFLRPMIALGLYCAAFRQGYLHEPARLDSSLRPAGTVWTPRFQLRLCRLPPHVDPYSAANAQSPI